MCNGRVSSILVRSTPCPSRAPVSFSSPPRPPWGDGPGAPLRLHPGPGAPPGSLPSPRPGARVRPWTGPPGARGGGGPGEPCPLPVPTRPVPCARGGRAALLASRPGSARTRRPWRVLWPFRRPVWSPRAPYGLRARARPRALPAALARVRGLSRRADCPGLPRPPRARARPETPPSCPEGRGPSAAPFVPARRLGVAPRARWGRGGSGPEPAPRVPRCRGGRGPGRAAAGALFSGRGGTRWNCALPSGTPWEAFRGSCGYFVMGCFEPALLSLLGPTGRGGRL